VNASALKAVAGRGIDQGDLGECRGAAFLNAVTEANSSEVSYARSVEDCDVKDKATVGRIVHFFSEAIANRDPQRPGYGLNGQGAGPYPAIVTQTSGDQYANLKILGWGVDAWDEGSVTRGSDSNPARYWIWPPRE
jgi:hypothetical protein